MGREEGAMRGGGKGGGGKEGGMRLEEGAEAGERSEEVEEGGGDIFQRVSVNYRNKRVRLIRPSFDFFFDQFIRCTRRWLQHSCKLGRSVAVRNCACASPSVKAFSFLAVDGEVSRLLVPPL